MNETLLLIITALLTVLVAVFAYNMIQESRYRNKIRSQFGHADQDALMNSQTQSVRDGQSLSHEKISADGKTTVATYKPSIIGKASSQSDDRDDEEIDLSDFIDDLPDADKVQPAKAEVTLSQTGLEIPTPSHHTDVLPAPTSSFMSGIRATFNRMLNSISDVPQPESAEAVPTATVQPDEIFDETKQPETNQAARQLLIDFADLKRSRLQWFDSRIDYMTYVALSEAQELADLPRFSSRYRVQMIGCTMDGLFQVAEPIPGVQYQAFIIGMQAINRNGLASERDLSLFGQQVEHFANNIGAVALLDDVNNFLTIAEPIDELCARVDQIIAIHLVSRVSILGSELRNSLEKLGFQLMQDGTFGYMSPTGEVKFTAVTLDGSLFTPQLLASQPYKGFSMLFDITRVPHGEQHFEEYIDLAISLSQNLHLELVDDQIQEVSTDWLKGVRSFVLDKQIEMIEARIPPGSELAQRVFS